MHAVDRLHRIAVEHALLDHQPGAALVFLGRLKDEMHGAGEIARLGEVAGGAEQHRRVAVMAAGMHPPGILRGMCKPVLLVDVQRVHVGAQRDRAPAGRVAGQRADHAGPGDAAFDRDAERLQQVRDVRGGADLLERGFRMGMDIVPPRRHIGLEIGNAVDDRHGGAQTTLRPRSPAMSPSL